MSNSRVRQTLVRTTLVIGLSAGLAATLQGCDRARWRDGRRGAGFERHRDAAASARAGLQFDERASGQSEDGDAVMVATRVKRMMGGAVIAIAAFGGAMTAAPAYADVGDGLRVARGNACMGCHAVDRKLVGPSFQQIAERYKNDKQAVPKLVKKVKDGGSGVWGAIPMPAHPRMSDADVRSVVQWVLAGAPSK